MASLLRRCYVDVPNASRTLRGLRVFQGLRQFGGCWRRAAPWRRVGATKQQLFDAVELRAHVGNVRLLPLRPSSAAARSTACRCGHRRTAARKDEECACCNALFSIGFQNCAANQRWLTYAAQRVSVAFKAAVYSTSYWKRLVLRTRSGVPPA